MVEAGRRKISGGSSVWWPMRGEHFLVTGGAGTIGSTSSTSS